MEIFGLLDGQMRRKGMVCVQSEVEGEAFSLVVELEMLVKYANRLSNGQWDKRFKCRILRRGQIW